MKIKGFTEKIIYITSLVGITATASYLLFSGTTTKRTQTKDVSIGYVRPLGQDVRIKGNTDLGWNDIKKDSSVFQADKVYTGNKSTAVVNLKSEQKLLVQPNSLIIIGDETDNVKINLSNGGGFLSELKKGVKLLVKRDNTETQIESDGATIQLESHNNNEIKLVVLKGEASVRNDETKPPIIVSANTEVKVTKEKIDTKPLKIELVSPLAGSALWSEQTAQVETHEINLKWSVVNEAASLKETPAIFYVDVSTDPMFEDKETYKTSSTSIAVKPKVGSVYFWRVRSKKDVEQAQENISATSSFSYFEKTKAVALENGEAPTTVFSDAPLLPAIEEVAKTEVVNVEEASTHAIDESDKLDQIAETNLEKTPEPLLKTNETQALKTVQNKTAKKSLIERTPAEYSPSEKSNEVNEQAQLENSQQKPQEQVKSPSQLKNEWNISALYGAKYLSISQSKDLGKASVGALFLDNLRVNSEFIYNDWSMGFQIDSYKFKYESLAAGDSKQLYGLNLYGSYKWFLFGLYAEQLPLFKNNSGLIEMTPMTLGYASVGVKHDLELSTAKPTFVKFRGWLSYPFTSASGNADVKLSSVQGFALNGQAELNRQIFSKEDYALYAIWLNQVGYRQATQNVEWGTTQGKAESQIFDLSTALGLLFKF